MDLLLIVAVTRRYRAKACHRRSSRHREKGHYVQRKCTADCKMSDMASKTDTEYAVSADSMTNDANDSPCRMVDGGDYSRSPR